MLATATSPASQNTASRGTERIHDGIQENGRMGGAGRVVWLAYAHHAVTVTGAPPHIEIGDPDAYVLK